MKNISEKDLQRARNYAAEKDRDLAAHVFDYDFGFADHVTDDDKCDYAAKRISYAKEIEAGEHDGNFTVWQEMNYFLTGECVPFLPRAE